MDYPPNIIAVEYIINKILPKLDKQYSLEIIGPKVPQKLIKCGNLNVNFLGYVESVKDALEKNDIFICPIIAGAGTKNKIIQAGEVGLPIVCTNLAIEGLNDDIKNVVYLANSETEFVEKINEINNANKEDLEKKIEEQIKIIEKYNTIDSITKKIL